MAVMKQLVKAGAEEVLKRLPFDQADTIVKSFGFKPGSSQDIFVREGGIHPTWGPGILNSIQKGEAQDLGRHITNATYNDQGALNEVARFGDNGVNQLNEDTIKANNLQQASGEAAPKQEDSLLFGPWPLKKGEGESFIPEIDDSLSKSLLAANDQKDLIKGLKTPLFTELAEHNIEVTPEELVSSGLFDTMIKRQGLLEEQTEVTKGYRGDLKRLSKENLPEGDRSLKRALKNFKTNNRSLRDLASLNLFTQTKDVFKINRDALKQQLKLFGDGKKEWHHTFFTNRQGGLAFLNQVAQDPMIAANLMLKLKRLEIPTSGTVANLSLLDQLPHDELHNLFREQGIELGDLDIGEYMKAIGDSVAKGETSINEMFDILDVYADVVMPYLKQKTEAAGPAFKNIKGFDETVKSYAKGTDVTLGRVEKPVKSKTKQKTIPNKPNKNGTRTKKR
tara:strand:+ start:2195 stop:3544 length:1350 start_codon:yes stop_codon:yes gene_type:complete